MTTTYKMAPKTLACFLLTLHFAPRPAIAQNCYFPNGDVADKDSPCPNSKVCCPLNWECMSNDLCYYDQTDTWERHTCTDQTWKSNSCPQYCTYNDTAIGNEAINKCSDGSFCCNFNGEVGDCCKKSDAEVLDISDGTPVATITSVGSPTSAPSATRKSSATSTTSSTSSGSASDSSSSSDSTTTPTLPPTTIITEATSSDSTGGIVLITSVITTTPTAVINTPTAAAASAPSNTSMTIGLAAGIPIFALAAAGMALLLWRRKKQKDNTYKNPPTSSHHRLSPDSNPNIVDMYAHSKHASEIDSYPIAVATSPTLTSPNRLSELSGSNHFMPGTNDTVNSSGAHSPAISSLTTTNGTTTPSDLASSPSIAAGGGGAIFSREPTLPSVQEAQELPPEGNPSRERDSSYIPYNQRYYANAWRGGGQQQQQEQQELSPPMTDGGGGSGEEGNQQQQQHPLGPRQMPLKRDDELGLD